MNAVFLHNIVEENGQTIRQNNLGIKHTIPLYSLVEIKPSCDDDIDDGSMYEYHRAGIRLYVVAHTRDCDGTPLYSLSFDKDAYNRWSKVDKDVKNGRFDSDQEASMAKAIWWNENGKIDHGYAEESLILIKEAK